MLGLWQEEAAMPFTLRRAPTRLLRIVALVAAMLGAQVPLAGARPGPVE